ncbi:hypothetical protein BJ741DRAFT_621174 [Chytriomyces cf. hyalinus JEL632]|nr:hypothetical protein BJ741DRAFT_621174 [Chytriomyces cf. hyalinus JEL632]
MSAHPILDLYFEESGDSLTKELSALRLKIPGLEDVSPILLPTTDKREDSSNRGPSPVRSLAFATTSMSPKPSYTSFNPPPPPSDPVPPVPPPRSRSRARLRPASEAQTYPSVIVASPIPVDALDPLLSPPPCQEPSNAEQLDDMFKSSKPMVDLSHYRSLSRSATHNNHFPTPDPLEMNEQQRGRSHRSSSSMGGSRSRSLNRIKSSASMVANMLRGKSRGRMDSRDDTMSIQSELNRSLDSPPETPGPPTSPSSPTLRESPFKSILRRQPKTTTTATITATTATTVSALEDKLDQLQQEKIALQKQQQFHTEQQLQQSPKDDLDFPGMFKSFTLKRRPTAGGDVGSPEPDSTLARKAASISGMKAELAALRAGKDLEAAAAASAEAAKAKKNAWYMNPGK